MRLPACRAEDAQAETTRKSCPEASSDLTSRNTRVQGRQPTKPKEPAQVTRPWVKTPAHRLQTRPPPWRHAVWQRPTRSLISEVRRIVITWVLSEMQHHVGVQSLEEQVESMCRILPKPCR